MTVDEEEENCFLRSKLYAQKYSEKSSNKKKKKLRLKCVFQTFSQTGNVKYDKAKRRRKVITVNEDNEFIVVESVIEHFHTS